MLMEANKSVIVEEDDPLLEDLGDDDDIQLFIDVRLDSMVDVDESSPEGPLIRDDGTSVKHGKAYYAVLWIEPDCVVRTPCLIYESNFQWNREIRLPLNKELHEAFLKIEVVRVCCECEVGTSNGEMVVGRGRFLLYRGMPNPTSGWFHLVRHKSGCVNVEGRVYFFLEIKRFYDEDYFDDRE